MEKSATEPSVRRETPSDKAIRLLGLKEIAYRCGITTDAVYKWPNRDGGRIPSKHQPTVLALAREKRADLSAEDLIAEAA